MPRRAPAPVTAVATALVTAAMVLSGCAETSGPSFHASPAGASGPASSVGAGTGSGHSSAAPPTAAAASPSPGRIVAQLATWVLPRTVSRAGVVADGNTVLVLGGLDAAGASLSTVMRLDPATGIAVVAGHLPLPAHDAAAALFGSTAYLFGGGTVSSSDAIQAVDAAPSAAGSIASGRLEGHLPTPRSDVSTVTIGATTLLVGGWDGTRILPAVLATRDGVHVRPVGTLAVPVRYAAVASAGGEAWIFGGQAAAGDVSTIQRFDPTSGRLTVAGRLPVALAGASAVSFGDAVFVLGGSVHGVATSRIWRFDPATGGVSVAGELPHPLAYAGLAVIGDEAYLLGGENTAILDSVIAIRPLGP